MKKQLAYLILIITIHLIITCGRDEPDYGNNKIHSMSFPSLDKSNQWPTNNYKSYINELPKKAGEENNNLFYFNATHINHNSDTRWQEFDITKPSSKPTLLIDPAKLIETSDTQEKEPNYFKMENNLIKQYGKEVVGTITKMYPTIQDFFEEYTQYEKEWGYINKSPYGLLYALQKKIFPNNSGLPDPALAQILLSSGNNLIVFDSPHKILGKNNNDNKEEENLLGISLTDIRNTLKGNLRVKYYLYRSSIPSFKNSFETFKNSFEKRIELLMQKKYSKKESLLSPIINYFSKLYNWFKKSLP